MSKFYITTAIAYTNAKPHLGHALEFIQADVVARFNRLSKNDTWFLTGTDEHGIKIARAAAAAGKNEQEFVDEIAQSFSLLDKELNISNDDFIRTTDRERHWPAVIKIWNKLVEKGDLYKKSYEGLYCVGHEAFIKKSELVDGRCPIHKTEPEKIKEENWFFKLSKYKKEVKEKIITGELKILPQSRANEIINLIDDAEDISFSRPKEGLKWGIPVPDDDTQTMYVWADALTNYISAIGYENETEQFKKFWPADIHLIGKDILRFHALYWPAMLLSAGISLPKSILVHGFITVDGEKMSKSLGNVIDPFELVQKYGSDVVRYFLIREVPSDEDGDFSYKKLEDRYNGDLANGLGNLVQRTLTLISNNLDNELIFNEGLIEEGPRLRAQGTKEEIQKSIENFRLHEALANIWELIGFANKYIDEKAPWKSVKNNPEEFLGTMTNTIFLLYSIAYDLVPFMPKTAQKIFDSIGVKDLTEPLNNFKFLIFKGEPLFPRLK